MMMVLVTVEVSVDVVIGVCKLGWNIHIRIDSNTVRGCVCVRISIIVDINERIMICIQVQCKNICILRIIRQILHHILNNVRSFFDDLHYKVLPIMCLKIL